MTQTILPRSDLSDTPWQTCTGLRAAAIDGAASLIVIEVLIDALSRLPQGPAALDAACARHATIQPAEALAGTPTEAAAAAVARALIMTAREQGDDSRVAA